MKSSSLTSSSRTVLWLASLLGLACQNYPVVVESFGLRAPSVARQQPGPSPWSTTSSSRLPRWQRQRSFGGVPAAASSSSSSHSVPDDDDDDECYLSPVPAGMEGVPIPFVETAAAAAAVASSQSLGFIECFADSLATCLGQEYTIGVPCDYAVALCSHEKRGGGESDDDGEELIPLELDDPELDDVFPVAEAIVADEFGEELVLQRTPQTLTLVGELEEDDDEDFDEDGENDDKKDDEDPEEEVEVLLKFEHRDREYQLVRFLDPILLVGKKDPDNPERCLLLTPEESDKVMPLLEGLFLDFHLQDNPDAILP